MFVPLSVQRPLLFSRGFMAVSDNDFLDAVVAVRDCCKQLKKAKPKQMSTIEELEKKFKEACQTIARYTEEQSMHLFGKPLSELMKTAQERPLLINKQTNTTTS